ncbi:invasion associated locus B family protein [Roseovarius pelagicus]|uniref:Invasion associated locus B family protein n=1 Tax=Roseovarius pelagicus TaxID=2980108 RepID=A0ABY6DDZ1_9RHOB|nr:invasion associated locus B family protein [Roseovarius pelagicus]UXX84069.1 invasion associated locus B family protein [Roseovarius pelagicus]
MMKELTTQLQSVLLVGAMTFGLGVAQAIAQSDDAPAVEDSTAATDAAPVDLANNASFGDWIVACEAATVRRTVCRLVQEQSLRENGQLVARFVAVPVSDGAILLAQTPMGTYLPGGAVYRFAGDDDTEQREMIWQRCLGDICEAAAPLDEDELALFAERDALLFGFRMSAEADPLILSVDISRFAEALTALRAATAEPAETTTE